ncbi:hypothetical protein XELAEV_18013879mg [Xenopus laevis]|uniref:Uncharacterized protein n=1 Tax=Xenopus laevis TaxID=8355 RepID=A0A974DQD5_XENLA|nr:hypothetical protein XELAEV_18013879mg [Xenopus laevis]
MWTGSLQEALFGGTHSYYEAKVCLVVTYNPHLESLRKTIMELQPILLNDKRLHNIFPEPPLLAYRHAPNLKGMIVLSSIQGPAENGTACKKETGQTLRQWMNSHRFNIKHGNTDVPVAAHFCSNTHTASKIFGSQF